MITQNLFCIRPIPHGVFIYPNYKKLSLFYNKQYPVINRINKNY